MFRNLTFLSNKSLISFIQKVSVVLYGLGLFTGFCIMMAGISSKNNAPEEALIFIGITIVFVLTFILLYAFMQIKLVPEIADSTRKCNSLSRNRGQAAVAS